MSNRTVLVLAAGVEVIASLGFIMQPRLPVRLLLGADLPDAGLTLARVTGFGMLSLGLACWPSPASLTALRALLVYNLLTGIFLVFVLIRGELAGILLIPSILLHATLAVLLAGAWLRSREGPQRPASPGSAAK